MTIASPASQSFHFILDDKVYHVRNELELALIFELLESTKSAEMLHWNVIMSLDEKLLDIIKTYRGLSSCLKHLGYRNRFLLLIKIGDILPTVLGRSEHLGGILASIPEGEGKLRIVKSMRHRGLVQIVENADDLGNVLEWLYGDAELVVLNLLGEEFLRGLFYSGRDIYKVAHFLSEPNKDYFIDLLGISSLRALTGTCDDFLYIIKALTASKTKEYIRLFTPDEIRGLIRSDYTFHAFVKKIAYAKEDELLRYLGYAQTESGWKITN